MNNSDTEIGHGLFVQALDSLVDGNNNGNVIFFSVDFFQHIYKKGFNSVCAESVREKYNFFHKVNTCRNLFFLFIVLLGNSRKHFPLKIAVDLVLL